mmetsp:Transcript_43162/g.100642  ORF Transcript_43162/g.100642 Transcript_43162/m.100642 type:complete len:380 (-) Transcript_43162:2570-3709(-)
MPHGIYRFAVAPRLTSTPTGDFQVRLVQSRIRSGGWWLELSHGHHVVVGASLRGRRVPLDEKGRDVVAVIAAHMGPALAAGGRNELDRLARALETQLLGGEVAALLAFDELPNAVGSDDGVPLVIWLHEELVVLRHSGDPGTSSVSKGPGHGEAGEVGAFQVDPPAALIDLADLAAFGFQARLLLGELRLVVLRAKDHPRVSAVPGPQHDPCISDEGNVDRLFFQHQARSCGARSLDVDALLSAEVFEVFLRFGEGFLQSLLPVLAKVLAVRQEVRDRLHQPEGNQVPEGAMPIANTVHGNGAHVVNEKVVLVRRRVRCRLLALLAQNRDLGGLLQFRGGLPGVKILVSSRPLLELRAAVDVFIHSELLPWHHAPEHHD